MEPTMSIPMVGGTEIVVILFVTLLVSVATAALTVIPFWKICSKAGFPGALALLMLVPMANIVLPFYIAFAKWPALPERY